MMKAIVNDGAVLLGALFSFVLLSWDEHKTVVSVSLSGVTLHR